jgi:TPR repeat protein
MQISTGSAAALFMTLARFNVAPVVALAGALAFGCAGTQGRLDARSAPAGQETPACVAGDLGPLRSAREQLKQPPCGSGPACGEACHLGDGVACFVRAIELEQEAHRPEAAAMYLSACRAGVSIGCTNYGAFLWARERNDACAKRLFEKACAVDDAWACGMFGRVIVDAAASSPSEAARAEPLRQGREILERSCQKLGRFSCRVLALEIESGKFGKADPSAVQALLARACATGDDESCGSPPSAASTFHAPP